VTSDKLRATSDELQETIFINLFKKQQAYETERRTTTESSSRIGRRTGKNERRRVLFKRTGSEVPLLRTDVPEKGHRGTREKLPGETEVGIRWIHLSGTTLLTIKTRKDMTSKKLIQCRGGKNRLNEDLTAQTAGEPGAARTSDREPQNGAQPVDDDELEAMTGGGMGQMIEGFRPKYICPYCGKDLQMLSNLNAHKPICPENPANKK